MSVSVFKHSRLPWISRTPTTIPPSLSPSLSVSGQSSMTRRSWYVIEIQIRGRRRRSWRSTSSLSLILRLPAATPHRGVAAPPLVLAVVLLDEEGLVGLLHQVEPALRRGQRRVNGIEGTNRPRPRRPCTCACPCTRTAPAARASATDR